MTRTMIAFMIAAAVFLVLGAPVNAVPIVVTQFEGVYGSSLSNNDDVGLTESLFWDGQVTGMVPDLVDPTLVGDSLSNLRLNVPQTPSSGSGGPLMNWSEQFLLEIVSQASGDTRAVLHHAGYGDYTRSGTEITFRVPITSVDFDDPTDEFDFSQFSGGMIQLTYNAPPVITTSALLFAPTFPVALTNENPAVLSVTAATPAVPEPSSTALLVAGGLGLLTLARRRDHK